MKTPHLSALGLAITVALLTACQGTPAATVPASPAPDSAQTVDSLISVSGNLSSLSLPTTQEGGGDILVQNKTNAPITVTIPAPKTLPGQLKLNVGSALDTFTQTIAANQTATIPYLAECPIDADTYTQVVDLKVGSDIKKTTITVNCTVDPVVENEPLDTTKVLQPADDKQLVAFDEEAKTATFIAGSSFAASLSAGDVIASGPIPAIAPDGLAFKIESISADRTTVRFSDADLGQMFDKADVNNELDPTFSDIDLKSSRFMPGITAMAGSGDTLLNLSFNEVLIGDKNNKDPNNYLVASGKLLVNKPKLVFKAELNAPLLGSLKIDEAIALASRSGGLTAEQLYSQGFFNSLVSKARAGVGSVTQFAKNTASQIVSAGGAAVDLVKNLSEGVSFNSQLYGEFTEQANLKIEGKANSKLTRKIMIGNVKFKPIALSLGGIPVTVTHELNLFIDMQGEVTGEVKYNVEQSFSYKAGVSYDSKSSPKVKQINEVTPTFTQEFQLYGNFDLDAKAVAEYDAKVFGTFGAFANAKIGPKVSARTEGDELKVTGEICASGDAGTREFEFKLPVIKQGIKLEGTNVNLFGSCFVRQEQTIKLPLVANLEYRTDGETKTTTGVTFDAVPEIDYGSSMPFKQVVVNPDANASYLYQWALDGDPLAVGTADKTVSLPASEIGKEHTLTAVVSVGTDPNVSLKKVTKKFTFKLKNSPPAVKFTTADPLNATTGQEVTLDANVSDNNETLDCNRVRWSSDASGYEITGQGTDANGVCFAKMKFPQAGSAKVYAQVTDSVNATTTAERAVTIN